MRVIPLLWILYFRALVSGKSQSSRMSVNVPGAKRQIM